MEKMMMPAYYNVLSTEEMTYTEGGATATMTEALLCWLITDCVPDLSLAS